jgi:hypothetical protein
MPLCESIEELEKQFEISAIACKNLMRYAIIGIVFLSNYHQCLKT